MCITLLCGCIGAPSNPAATQPATAINPVTTQPSYWLEMPAAVIASNDFDKLWNACDQSARDFQFTIDRTDYRAGLMTTRPMTSAQWFELWRPDWSKIDDPNQSSLAAIRRTVRFEFTRHPDGGFAVSPKVLVERETLAERRITSVVSYSSSFNRVVNPREAPGGTRESDVGIQLSPRYWYLTGRDEQFESALANAIQNHLK